jgi:hypothetical protein
MRFLIESFFNREVIYSLKDLVRQCVIIGSDRTTHFGGYPNATLVQQNELVYICDLAALQFQKSYNSGRLVLIHRKPIKLYSLLNPTEGLIDDLIFENIVKEKKLTFGEVSKLSSSERYVKLRKNCYFDSYAYKKFVINDILLTGIALNDCLSEDKVDVNFKFLKYGTGFFAGSLSTKQVLEQNISDAVIDGFEQLFEKHDSQWIKSIEFPFYEFNREQENRLKILCQKFNKEY